jgi:hypothetical protein
MATKKTRSQNLVTIAVDAGARHRLRHARAALSGFAGALELAVGDRDLRHDRLRKRPKTDG